MTDNILEAIARALFMQPQLYGDDNRNKSISIDLNLCYSIPDHSNWSNSDETRNHKRPKRVPNAEESIASGIGFCSTICNSNTGNLNSLPRLKFRDYVAAYAERYLAIHAMEEADVAMIRGEKNEDMQDMDNEMKLLQQLIACAEAVACRDKTHASALLSELRANALVFGTSFQRVASCFVQGLSDRLSQVQVLGSAPKSITYTAEKDEAMRLVYQLCPQIQFAHFVANSLILEAFEGESSVHVVDLGMSQGLCQGQQWCKLMQSLAYRANQTPCRLRISGVGTSSERLQAIGDELGCYARSLGVKFQFLSVKSSLENLKLKDFNLVKGEVVVINSILHLHSIVKESRGALNSVLQMLRQLSPKLLILVEQDSSHNGPFFLGRFMEALHYYSAVFDSLDAMLPKYDTRRAKIEQFFYAEEIKNIVSCEGPARVERHERIDQWRRRLARAGFQASPTKMLMQVKNWLGEIKACEGYTVMDEKRCLVLAWKSKPIIAASCWK